MLSELTHHICMFVLSRWLGDSRFLLEMVNSGVAAVINSDQDINRLCGICSVRPELEEAAHGCRVTYSCRSCNQESAHDFRQLLPSCWRWPCKTVMRFFSLHISPVQTIRKLNSCYIRCRLQYFSVVFCDNLGYSVII
jgi:hypothetical protein